MRKIGIVLAGLCTVNSAMAANVTTLSPRFEKCLQWKQVCSKKKSCIQREQTQNDCYRCVKPGRYGFHAYPRQVDRSTCNAKTVNFLRNMGYNCYHDTESSPCVKTSEKESCDRNCAKYVKKTGE